MARRTPYYSGVLNSPTVEDFSGTSNAGEILANIIYAQKEMQTDASRSDKYYSAAIVRGAIVVDADDAVFTLASASVPLISDQVNHNNKTRGLRTHYQEIHGVSSTSCRTILNGLGTKEADNDSSARQVPDALMKRMKFQGMPAAGDDGGTSDVTGTIRVSGLADRVNNTPYHVSSGDILVLYNPSNQQLEESRNVKVVAATNVSPYLKPWMIPVDTAGIRIDGMDLMEYLEDGNTLNENEPSSVGRKEVSEAFGKLVSVIAAMGLKPTQNKVDFTSLSAREKRQIVTAYDTYTGVHRGYEHMHADLVVGTATSDGAPGHRFTVRLNGKK